MRWREGDPEWGTESRCLVVVLVGVGAMASWLIPVIDFALWVTA